MSSERHRTANRPRTAWHTWAFAAFMLLLYVIGLYGFVMLLGPNDGYVLAQGWGADGIAYFTGYPLALRLLWAVHLAAGLAAPILLVAGLRAAPAFALTTVVTQLLLMVATFGFLGRLAALGPVTALIDSSVLVVTALFWWYTRQRVATWSGRDRSSAA